jgi:zinc and cadmium transporter
MPIILWIILGSLLGSIVAVGLAYVFLYKLPWTHERSHGVVSFAAGVLLAVAFLDLLPESLEKDALASQTILQWVFFGVVAYYFIEHLLLWYHCHKERCEVHTSSAMIILGDIFHNFLDGVAITAAFLLDIKLGIVTSLAVTLHEIPQEISDLAVLVSGGMKKQRALLVNIASASVSLLGALLAYVFFADLTELVPVLAALTAGGFIYIATADLIPESHRGGTNRAHITSQFIIFLFGIMVVLIFGKIFQV